MVTAASSSSKMLGYMVPGVTAAFGSKDTAVRGACPSGVLSAPDMSGCKLLEGDIKWSDGDMEFWNIMREPGRDGVPGVCGGPFGTGAI